MPELPKDAPEVLFLQWWGPSDPDPDACFVYGEDTTWCRDRINDSDLRYVREPALLPRPIATAPKDGTHVLLYSPTLYKNLRWFVGYWDEDRFAKRQRPYWHMITGACSVSDSRANQPTHWLPLPPSPKVEEDK